MPGGHAYSDGVGDRPIGISEEAGPNGRQPVWKIRKYCYKQAALDQDCSTACGSQTHDTQTTATGGEMSDGAPLQTCRTLQDNDAKAWTTTYTALSPTGDTTLGEVTLRLKASGARSFNVEACS